MQITYRDMFIVKDTLDKIWCLSLSPKLFIFLRRLAKNIEMELKTFEPERIKLFNRHSQFDVDNMFNTPTPETNGYNEFITDYNDVFSSTVDIQYTNVDIENTKTYIENSNIDIAGTIGNSLLNILEELNKLNNGSN